jgi:hypothetical protein
METMCSSETSTGLLGEGGIHLINSTGIHELHSDFEYITMRNNNTYYVRNIESVVQAPVVEPPCILLLLDLQRIACV